MKAALVFLALCLPALADFAAGQRAYNRNEYETALKEFLPLAKLGNADAQMYLGLMYEFGHAVPQDLKEAVKWYRLAADQGHRNAQTSLGGLYRYGKGVPQDHMEAAKWYRQAADQGEAGAQTVLGMMYYKGEGVPQDYILSHMWFNLAGAAGVDIGGRDMVAAKMTPEQIAEAQRLARDWKPKGTR